MMDYHLKDKTHKTKVALAWQLHSGKAVAPCSRDKMLYKTVTHNDLERIQPTPCHSS